MPDNIETRKLAAIEQKIILKTKMAPVGMLHMDIEINTYGNDKVGIVSFEEDFALIVQSKKIHDSLKSLFELAWNLLPENKA